MNEIAVGMLGHGSMGKTHSNGAVGVLEASRVAGGHLVTSRFEADGSKGSIQFSLDKLSRLRVAEGHGGFRSIPVLRESDTYQANWFPPGHPLGWVDTFSHEALHILWAIAGLHDMAPLGATFEDGYRWAEVVEAIAQAAEAGSAVQVNYRA